MERRKRNGYMGDLYKLNSLGFVGGKPYVLAGLFSLYATSQRDTIMLYKQ